MLGRCHFLPLDTCYLWHACRMCKGGELRMAPILHGVFLVRWDTGLFTGLKEFHWLSVFWAQFRMLVMAFKTLNAPGAWDLKDLLAIKSIKWGPSWDATTGRRKDSEYPWEVFLMAVPRSCGIPSHWKLERPPHSLLLDGNKNILFFPTWVLNFWWFTLFYVFTCC